MLLGEISKLLTFACEVVGGGGTRNTPQLLQLYFKAYSLKLTSVRAQQIVYHCGLLY